MPLSKAGQSKASYSKWVTAAQIGDERNKNKWRIGKRRKGDEEARKRGGNSKGNSRRCVEEKGKEEETDRFRPLEPYNNCFKIRNKLLL